MYSICSTVYEALWTIEIRLDRCNDLAVLHIPVGMIRTAVTYHLDVPFIPWCAMSEVLEVDVPGCV